MLNNAAKTTRACRLKFMQGLDGNVIEDLIKLNAGYEKLFLVSPVVSCLGWRM
jgi:hypothetical protein